ncbi:hypothetical protein ES703_06208 [subsurface metagenome]
MKGLTGTRAIFLLIVIALVVVLIYLGVTYFQDRGREGTLEDEIAEVEVQIALMAHGDISALQEQLASLQEQLGEVHFPEDVHSTLIFALIHNSATTAGIEDYSFSESGTTQRGVDGSDTEYQLYPFEVTAAGTLDEIFEFLGEMEDNMPYDAVIVQDVDLTYDSETEIWEITFEIVIFAQPS